MSATGTSLAKVPSQVPLREIPFISDTPTVDQSMAPSCIADSTSGADLRRVIEVELYVTKHLNSDILLGEDSLNALKAYELNDEDFFSVPRQSVSSMRSINRILDISDSIENVIRSVKRQVRRGLRLRDSRDVEGTISRNRA